MSYIKCNDSPYGQVLTLTETSWTYIKYYSGIPNVFNRPSLFFDTAQSTFLLQAIATQSYIYIAARDQSILNKYSNGYLKNYVLPYLPVVFNNSAVTIYEVPKISVASSNSNLAFVKTRAELVIDDSLINWAVRTQSGTINNITKTYSNHVFQLSGYLNSTIRDYYLLNLQVSGLSTNDYPDINIKWKSTDSCATFEIKYSDGAYLSDSASSQIISKSLPDWTVTTINQPSNKTISSIMVGIDIKNKPSVGGLQTVSVDYIALHASDTGQLALSTALLAASGSEYELSLDSDPNLSKYSTLLLPSDIATNELSDDFSNDLSQWSIVSGDWSINNGEMHQKQITPYVDAVINIGDPTWADYSVSVQAQSTGKLSDDFCLQFRYQDPKNTYDFRLESGLLRVGKFVNGFWIQLANATNYEVSGDTWYKLGVSVQGNRIQCFLNDQQVFNVVDSTYSSGKVALRTEGIAAAFDNLTVQTSDHLALFNRYVDFIEQARTWWF